MIVGYGRRRLDDVLGGRARRRVVVVLTCVLALATADQGALGATAISVQDYFDISKAEFGVLGSITTAVTVVVALPFGVYVDRVTRTRMLGWVTVLWAVAMVASGLATGFLFLMCARVFLGTVIAVAYPTIASLIGDYFPTSERGRIYGFVLSGELIGTAIGIVLASLAASAFGTWRAAMLVLALPAVAVCWLVFRLPEPARGGASRMPAGQREVLSAERVRRGEGPDGGGEEPAPGQGESLVEEQVAERGIEPRHELVLDDDPSELGLPAAIRYVLRVRTNVIVIVAGALGYYFFSGLRFFGIQWIQEHYGVSRDTASSLVLLISIVSVGGVVAGGRFADGLLRRGRITARVVVPAVTIVAAAVLFAPGIATSSVVLALALTLPGAFLFAASNPPLDAARLDVMPSRLWGRAESVRTLFRGALEASAPITFGFVAGAVFGGRSSGLTATFLVMLVPLVFSGLILMLARMTYPRDVATAVANDRRRTSEPQT